MKFKFKGVSSFEENAQPNFMGEASSYNHIVLRDFDDMDEAVKYVVEHHGFMVTDSGKHAFVVRYISEVG
jgi:hypothetical protein